MRDQTVGRPTPTDSALVYEDNEDYNLGTFPDYMDLSNDAAIANLPDPLAILVDDYVAHEKTTVKGNDNSDGKSDDNSDDNADDDSDNNSDDNSEAAFDGTPDENTVNNSDNESGKRSRCEKDQQVLNQPIDANRPKKRALRTITYNKSSRRARDADVPLNENAAPRKINPTNLIADAVASLHPMRAMRPGRMEPCLTHSLKESFPFMSDQNRSILSSHLLATLGTMARVHTDLLREGLLVIDLYIARTFRTFPAIDGDRGQEHGHKRMEHFNNILLKGKRESFFLRLVNRLIRWDSDASDLKKASSPALLACDNIFQEYMQITSQRQAPPFRPKDRDVCEGSFLSQCARTLSDMVGGHANKFLLELKQRVSQVNYSHLILILHADADPSTRASLYR